MKYHVLWVPGAEQRLADLWLNATDRGAITKAPHAIDQRLRDDPLDDGESRPGGRRILFETPLAVLYRVIEQDMFVHVLHVWLYE
jgi:hypothetical protein